MCGIFGALFLDDGAQIDVDAALESIAHRGPDGSGIARGRGWILGHQRLAVIDLTPAGAQPMRSDDGRVVVTFNGEIYNHHELRRQLEARGHRFRSRTDTEVIVEGYRAWGAAVVERLDGMFALGIWDDTQERLLLARDRSGKKPLYYASSSGGFRFASEIKALLASGQAAAVDETNLSYLFSLGYVPAPFTLFRGIAQLPPASTLVLDRGRSPVVTRYWRAPFGTPRLRISERDAREQVRRLVERAVTKRLEADVPLGAFLSGGIDSTIIVGTMAKQLGRKVKTFSIGFSGDARFDETRYARVVAQAFETDHTEFVVEPTSFDLAETLVGLYDGPFGDPSAIPTFIVSKLTRQSVTVALTGDGGDELFCGYARFLAADAAERVPRFARETGRKLLSALPQPRMNSRRSLARLHRLLFVATQPLPLRLLSWISFFDPEEILRADVRAEFGLGAPALWSESICRAYEGGSPLSRTLGHNFDTFLPEDLLVKADRCSMANSLELRSPFLDADLIDYAARLPDRLLRSGSNTKWILKKAFDDLLPGEVKSRGKMGFGVPLGTWFRGEWREQVLDWLGSGALCYDFVDRGFVEQIIHRHMTRAADHGFMLWLLTTFEIWLRTIRTDRFARPKTLSFKGAASPLVN